MELIEIQIELLEARKYDIKMDILKPFDYGRVPTTKELISLKDKIHAFEIMVCQIEV